MRAVLLALLTSIALALPGGGTGNVYAASDDACLTYDQLKETAPGPTILLSGDDLKRFAEWVVVAGGPALPDNIKALTFVNPRAIESQFYTVFGFDENQCHVATDSFTREFLLDALRAANGEAA